MALLLGDSQRSADRVGLANCYQSCLRSAPIRFGKYRPLIRALRRSPPFAQFLIKHARTTHRHTRTQGVQVIIFVGVFGYVLVFKCNFALGALRVCVCVCV